jgi:iron-sulfur cluster repair protein YtfE (RIC family)
MNQVFNLDMTMMYAVHDAFRRDLAHIDKMTSRTEGWDRFSRFLHFHHVAEDEALWPVVRDAVGDQPDDLKLVDDMVTEHAGLGPLLEAIDAALTHGESAPEARADLAVRLQEHLTHEEDAALPVIDRTLTEEQWMQFGEAATERIGADMPHFLPWLLDGADTERTNAVLGRLPEPAQQTYRDEWQPAYAANDWWDDP